MTRLMTVLLFVLILQFSASSRLFLANVYGNPHDLFKQGYLYVREDQKSLNPQCLQCHISATDNRPLIWQWVPESLKRYGAVGNQCASCHDGVSMVDRNVDGGMTVFNPESHGSDPEQAPVDTNLGNTGLPYTPGKIVTCITCHDPHTEKYRPFLRVPLEGICQRCHFSREHEGIGVENITGSHPVNVDPFDRTGGPSPIDVDEKFSVQFPKPYPLANAYLSSEGHWTLGGHLTFGSYGRVECTTCHSFHGVENSGPLPGLLSKDPVKIVSNEFCEGCHKGVRGDEKLEPPYPNPGGTITGRTYHPLDDDEANGIGWNVAIADTTERSFYEWGGIDPDTELPVLLCTTCHVAHRGMENSPALVPIADATLEEGVETFCEICHREPPLGHHGYSANSTSPDNSGELIINFQNLGHTFGEPSYDRIYCSFCHRAHNAGFGGIEENFIPILVDRGTDICSNCHELGVSHFMGDPTLPSTYEIPEPHLYRGIWPASGKASFYEGEGETPTTITCESCHYFSTPADGSHPTQARLLAPADEETEWYPGYPEDYLCTGCHGEAPATVGEGRTHPLMEADMWAFPNISATHLSMDEIPVTYTYNGTINCHSCHKTHNAVVRGGVYILKVARGENIDPKAIHPEIDFTALCHSCHPMDEY
jgi:predicted CXXCH cytochrome family protein